MTNRVHEYTLTLVTKKALTEGEKEKFVEDAEGMCPGRKTLGFDGPPRLVDAKMYDVDDWFEEG